jgi:NAD(P)-dependent dehydrogenase (short-subunit alcohol dehydrogenase family)
MKVKDKNVIITGGSIGFGKALAEKFLSEGANVLICSRNEQQLFDTKSELTSKFPNQTILAKKCDVSIEKDVKEFITYSIDVFKTIHVLILNAGVYGPMGPIETVSLDEWKKSIDINLFGVLLPCRELIPHFKQNEFGKIIVLSGGGATSPMPNLSSYATAKAAVIRLVETLSKELYSYNVDVNAIAPGALSTRMMEQVINAGPEVVGDEFFKKNQNWKQNGATPMELGTNLAVYLASSNSDGITGKLISAQWDDWKNFESHLDDLQNTDIYTLRRIVPEDRNKEWN